MNHTDMYTQAFQYTPGYAYLLDKHGMLLDCNARLLQLLGLSAIPETTPGSWYKIMSEHGLWSEEQIKLLKKNDIDVILSAEAQLDKLELPIIDKQEMAIYYQISRIPLLDNSNHVYGLLVLLADVTHERQLTDQLEKITRQLQKQNASTTISAHNPTSHHKTTPPNILIVEDNPIAQKAAQAI